MSVNSQQTIDLIATLRAIPVWTVQDIEGALGVQLARDKRSTAKIKRYDAPERDGLFSRASLTQPIFGGHLGWRVSVRVREAGDVRHSDLAALIPAGSTRFVSPPPSPGSPGPWPFRHGIQAADPLGECSFSFLFRDDKIDRLEGLGLSRPHPGNEPSHFDASCFQAQPAKQGYVIARTPTGTAAVVVSKLTLEGRELALSYVATEVMIGEPLARQLIRGLLLEGLLGPELAGQYDKVAFTATELASTVRL